MSHLLYQISMKSISTLLKNRAAAGRFLVRHLEAYRNQTGVVVVGLTRGGVVVAHEIAEALHLPLDFMIIKKIGAPHNSELAIGAVTENKDILWDEDWILDYGIPQDYCTKAVSETRREIERQSALYRCDYPSLDLKNKIVLLVDDGIATGMTFRAAIESIRKKGALGVVAVAPVASRPSLVTISSVVDDIVVPYQETLLSAVGAYYEDFPQVTDKEMLDQLRSSRNNRVHRSPRSFRRLASL